MKNNLTPFLKAVIKALNFELEQGSYQERKQKQAIFDEIIQNLPAENSTPNFCANLS